MSLIIRFQAWLVLSKRSARAVTDQRSQANETPFFKFLLKHFNPSVFCFFSPDIVFRQMLIIFSCYSLLIII